MTHSPNEPSNSSRALSSLRRIWRSVLLVITLFASFGSHDALAGDGPIVVAKFQGAKEKSIRELVIQLLRADGYDVVSDADSPNLNPQGGDAEFIEAAKKGGYRAFILGSTELDAKSWATSITVREGKSGKTIGSIVIESGWYPGLQKALKQRLMSHISGPLSTAEAPDKETAKAAPVVVEEPKAAPPPPKEEPKAEPKQEPAEEQPEAEEKEQSTNESVELDESPTPTTKKRDPFNNLELDAGGLFVQRAWVISDSLSGTLDGPISPTHDASMMGIRVGAVIYPIGFFSKSFMRHVGIEGTFLRSLYGQTPLLGQQGESDSRDTVFQEYTASLRGRIPAGPVQIGIFGGIGAQSLTLAGEKIIAALPDANYKFFRAGVDLAVPFSKALSAKAGFAYRATYTLGKDPGQVEGPDWFPNARGKAIELLIQGDYAFSKTWALRLGGFMSRYALAFNPDATEVRLAARRKDPAPPVAGGAVDLYAGGTITAVLTLQ